MITHHYRVTIVERPSKKDKQTHIADYVARNLAKISKDVALRFGESAIISKVELVQTCNCLDC